MTPTPAETVDSREREPSIIPGKYEHINLRHAVESYDRHDGKINAAVMRAINYAVMRLNVRAVRLGIPPEKLFYSGHYPERSPFLRKISDAIIALLRGGEIRLANANARAAEIAASDPNDEPATTVFVGQDGTIGISR